MTVPFSGFSFFSPFFFSKRNALDAALKVLTEMGGVAKRQQQLPQRREDITNRKGGVTLFRSSIVRKRVASPVRARAGGSPGSASEGWGATCLLNVAEASAFGRVPRAITQQATSVVATDTGLPASTSLFHSDRG
jgi:hypothetical protein